MNETERQICPQGRTPILAEIESAEHLSAMTRALLSIQERLGFSYYKLFVERPALNASLRDQLLLSNFPDEFFARLDDIGIAVPPPQELFSSEECRTHSWTLAEIDVHPPVQREQLRQLLARYGINRGVYFSLHAVEGPSRVVAFYGERGALAAEEFDDLSLLAFPLLHRVSMLEKRQEGGHPGISALELSCLRLAAAGQSSAKIASLTGLSPRTVHYLCESLCRKLGADTLEHALTEAIRRGYLP